MSKAEAELDNTVLVAINPMSVNEAWQGRKYKTPSYKKYERDVLYLLPRYKIPEGNLAIFLEFGVSNTCMDWDNPIKPFVDILQKKYVFNDSRIYQAEVTKRKVDKGMEYVKFRLQAVGQ